MRTHNKQSGFALLELVLVLAVLTAAGLTAWYVYDRQRTVTPNSSSGKSTTTAAALPNAPAINNSGDLNTALNDLNQADPSSDNNDLAQLNSQSGGF